MYRRMRKALIREGHGIDWIEAEEYVMALA